MAFKNNHKNNKIKIESKYKPQILDFDYLGCPIDEIYERFKTSESGLTEKEAKNRLEEYGLNEPAKKKKRTILRQILSKFINPLVIILLIIGVFSLYFSELRGNTRPYHHGKSRTAHNA